MRFDNLDRDLLLSLGLVWISGLCFGILFCCIRSDSAAATTCFLNSYKSVLGIFLVFLLPILLAQFCCWLGFHRALLCIVFFKGILLSYCSRLVFSSFGSKSGLPGGLFLSADFLSAFFLWLCLCRRSSIIDNRFLSGKTACSIVAALTYSVIYYCFISPFLASMI